MDADQDWQRLLEGLRTGDPKVVREFYQQYGQWLHEIAATHLAPQLRRRFDAEDVVQSALRTFFRRAGAGQFQFEDNERLWSLLCAITLTKLREKARYHQRQKRSVRRESQPEQKSDESGASWDMAASGLSPDAAAEFGDLFERFVRSLDEEAQRVVELKLQDHTNDEVAVALGISERTVRRIVKRVQGQLQRALAAD